MGKGVSINRGTQGASVLIGSDGTSALIGHGVAVAGKIALLQIKTLFQLKDAEDLGLDKAYDTANNVRVWYHIKEFYRLAAPGTKLFIMLVDNAVVGGNLTVKLADIIDDVNSTMAKALLIAGGGEIRQMGFMMNPAATYVSVLLNGIDSDVSTSIAKAQTLYDWADARFMPAQMYLEGREFNGSAAAAQDLRAIANVAAHKVSVIIGQDWDYAETQNAIGKKHAAIGTFLGTEAGITVNTNAGDGEDAVTSNITDTANFLTPGLSSHEQNSTRIDDLDTLDTKAYIFVQQYIGLDGVRWSNDGTCTPVAVDSQNNLSEYSVSYGRTMDKYRRLLRAKLLPKVKTNVNLDPTTGKLSPGTVEYFNGLGDDVFKDGKSRGEISGGKTIVNKDSNLSVAPRNLEIGFELVPNGQIDAIVGKINLKTAL